MFQNALISILIGVLTFTIVYNEDYFPSIYSQDIPQSASFRIKRDSMLNHTPTKCEGLNNNDLIYKSTENGTTIFQKNQDKLSCPLSYYEMNQKKGELYESNFVNNEIKLSKLNPCSTYEFELKPKSNVKEKMSEIDYESTVTIEVKTFTPIKKIEDVHLVCTSENIQITIEHDRKCVKRYEIKYTRNGQKSVFQMDGKSCTLDRQNITGDIVVGAIYGNGHTEWFPKKADFCQSYNISDSYKVVLFNKTWNIFNQFNVFSHCLTFEEMQMDQLLKYYKFDDSPKCRQLIESLNINEEPYALLEDISNFACEPESESMKLIWNGPSNWKNLKYIIRFSAIPNNNKNGRMLHFYVHPPDTSDIVIDLKPNTWYEFTIWAKNTTTNISGQRFTCIEKTHSLQKHLNPYSNTQSSNYNPIFTANINIFTTFIFIIVQSII